MAFTLPELPYSKDALNPYISEETIDYHYNKHHQTYVNKLNTLIKGTEFENKTLEQIITSSSNGIFNNAAQVWNHTFYWKCLGPALNIKPPSQLMTALEKTFGSFTNFQTAFTESAINNFGSGWTWLVKKHDNTLSILNTTNAGTPLTEGYIPILTCDVWEHAYYIDYRNARPEYLKAFWSLIDWKNIEATFLN